MHPRRGIIVGRIKFAFTLGTVLMVSTLEFSSS
jgi:hypothetical protein